MWYMLGLGSNLAPRHHLPLLLRALFQLSPTLHLGRVVQTDPVGVVGDPFLNLPVCLQSDLTPPQLKRCCNALEEALGRDRGAPDSKTRSRTADLDILFSLEPGAGRVSPACLPREPYMRPMVLELLAYLAVETGLTVPTLPPGVPLPLGDLTVGAAPQTIELVRGHPSPQLTVVRESTSRESGAGAPHADGVPTRFSLP